jgi:membrane-associated phospholipid phosphatase
MIKNCKICGVLLLITIILPALTYGQPNSIGTFGSRLVNEFPSIFISDANATFTNSTNIAALLIAGGASIAMHNTDADKNINENLHRRAFNDTTDKIFDIGGNPFTHLGVTGLWYLASQSNNDELNCQRAESMLSALILTDAVTLGLKAIRNNETPNGKDFAWPSGHTASSFCVASVLDEYYGPQVGIPAYIGAAMVGWRMMDSGDHWASDVLFGGTLGYIVGHTVAGKHKHLDLAGFQIQPLVSIDNSRPASGLCLVKRF